MLRDNTVDTPITGLTSTELDTPITELTSTELEKPHRKLTSSSRAGGSVVKHSTGRHEGTRGAVSDEMVGTPRVSRADYVKWQCGPSVAW
jgi:hypothetical protein